MTKTTTEEGNETNIVSRRGKRGKVEVESDLNPNAAEFIPRESLTKNVNE